VADFDRTKENQNPNAQVQSKPVSLEEMIANDFRTIDTISVTDLISRLVKSVSEHGGNWPSHLTACEPQVRRWEREITLQARSFEHPTANALTILNARVVERPGPITLIWSGPLA
jgi:hypothetical protein